MIPLFCAVHVRSVEVLSPIPVLEFHTVTHGTVRVVVWLSYSFPIPSVPQQPCRWPTFVSSSCLQPPTSRHFMATTCLSLAVAPAEALSTPTCAHHPHLNSPPPPPTVTWVGPPPFRILPTSLWPRLCLGSSDPRTHVEPGRLPFKVRFERNP